MKNPVQAIQDAMDLAEFQIKILNKILEMRKNLFNNPLHDIIVATVVAFECEKFRQSRIRIRPFEEGELILPKKGESDGWFNRPND